MTKRKNNTRNKNASPKTPASEPTTQPETEANMDAGAVTSQDSQATKATTPTPEQENKSVAESPTNPIVAPDKEQADSFSVETKIAPGVGSGQDPEIHGMGPGDNNSGSLEDPRPLEDTGDSVIDGAYRASIFAASAAINALGGEENDLQNAMFWPMLGEFEETPIDVLKTYAGFVRRQASNDAELANGAVMYIYGAQNKMHPGPQQDYLNQPLWIRMAFETFCDVIKTLDAAIEAEKKKLADLKSAEQQKVPIEDTMLETF